MSVKDDLKRATDKLKGKPTTETDAPTVSAAQTARTEKKTPPTVTAGKTGKAKGRPKTGKETLSKRVALTVKPSVYAALTERAEAADTTVNALINKVLNEYLINT